ncbi:CHAP domain-containing protein [Nonomuraea africana]|nr:CHAP domain-containing protein [Nonomuraea africana]
MWGGVVLDPIAEGLLEAARPELGYREQGGQYTKFGKWYADLVQDSQYRNAPWCDMFISWAAQKAGVQEFVGQFAWTPSHAAWFIKQGAWSQRPEPGALVFYDWKGGKSYKGIDHVGIVEKVVGSKIHTIEANVDRVWLKRKVRDADQVVGYGLPRMVKERPGLIEVRPSEQPVEPFSIQAALPGVTVEREGSPFDVLGTPQALLAAMVLTTVVVSFRVAGRSRGSGRHRRGFVSWLATSSRATGSTFDSGATLKTSRVTSTSGSTRATGGSSAMRPPGSGVGRPSASPPPRSEVRRAPASPSPGSLRPPATVGRAASSARGASVEVPRAASPARAAPVEVARGGSRGTSGAGARQVEPPAVPGVPRPRAAGTPGNRERLRGPVERSAELAQAGRTSGSGHQPTSTASGGTAKRRRPYEATTGK